MKMLCRLFFIIIATGVGITTAETFTFLAPVYKDGYYDRVLRLALDKTKQSHGAYTIVYSSKMSDSRARERLRNGAYENGIRVGRVWAEQDYAQYLTVPFPLLRGVVGYRVCFHSAALTKRVAAIQTLNDLKKFSFVQGASWPDTTVLQHHGFNVLTYGENDLDLRRSIMRMYEMAARGEVDFFCRGAGEAIGESATGQIPELPQLVMDKTLAIYYHNPAFYFLQKNNTKAAERIYEGLIKAYQDESLLALWRQEVKPSIDGAELGGRKLYVLSNPWLEGIDRKFEAYIYYPAEEASPGISPEAGEK